MRPNTIHDEVERMPWPDEIGAHDYGTPERLTTREQRLLDRNGELLRELSRLDRRRRLWKVLAWLTLGLWVVWEFVRETLSR